MGVLEQVARTDEETDRAMLDRARQAAADASEQQHAFGPATKGAITQPAGRGVTLRKK